MLVLDTDHLSSFGYPSVASERLGARLAAANQDVATTAVCCDEQLSGVLAAIHRVTDPFRQIIAYGELLERIEFLAGFTLLPWDQESARRFVQFREDRVRCGTMDLKIACVTLAHDTTLLTRNTSDFAQVPGLKFENWLG